MLKGLKFIYRISINTISKWVADEIPMHGAALAFYTIFSLAPVLIIIVALFGWLWGDTAALYQIERLIDEYFDRDMAITISQILEQATGRKGLAMPIIGGATLVFASTTAIAQLKFTLNIIWGIKIKDGKGLFQFLLDRLLGLVIVFSLTMILILSVIADALLSAFIPHIENFIPLDIGLLGFLNTALLWLSTYTLFLVVFKILPDVSLRWRDVSVGAMLTTALFMLGKFGISWYLSSYGSYDVFGAAGTLVVLLIWVYYNAQVVFLGAEYIQVYMTMKARPMKPKRFAYLEEMP